MRAEPARTPPPELIRTSEFVFSWATPRARSDVPPHPRAGARSRGERRRGFRAPTSPMPLRLHKRAHRTTGHFRGSSSAPAESPEGAQPDARNEEDVFYNKGDEIFIPPRRGIGAARVKMGFTEWNEGPRQLARTG